MLDKAVPFADVLMCRPQGAALASAPLPRGYRFSFFQQGDEAAWANIETSVLEFDQEAEALSYFQREFLPFLPELVRRCLFVEDANGEKVATCTAWWNYTGIRRDPWLYWLAVKPSEQGNGLGKALIARTTQLMIDMEGDRNFYLHTQTWSHKAIGLYERLGYQITDVPELGPYTNGHYDKALAILGELYPNR